MWHRLSRIGFIALGITVWPPCLAMAAGARQVAPATVKEAKELVHTVLRNIDQPGPIHPGIRAEFPLPLLALLDSGDSDVRALGSRTFRQLLFRKYVLVDACLPYLDPARPAEGRIPLLAFCTGQLGEVSTDLVCSKAAAQKLRTLLKHALDSNVCPPSFDALAAAVVWQNSISQRLAKKNGIPITDLVRPERAASTTRRLLQVLVNVEHIYRSVPVMRSLDGRVEVLEAIFALGEKRTGEVVENWYRAEPNPRARSVVVSKELSWSRNPEWQARRKAILGIAAKDWDEKIATEAKALLAQ